MGRRIRTIVIVLGAAAAVIVLAVAALYRIVGGEAKVLIPNPMRYCPTF